MKNNLKVFKKGDIIFKEGTKGDAVMYDIWYGTVGIFRNYGTASEVKLNEQKDGYFGEMGLLEDTIRSATVVALDECGLKEISASEMESYFTENPMKIDLLLQTMSKRIRNRGEEYMDACRCIDAYMTATQNDEKPDPVIIESMKAIVKS